MKTDDIMALILIVDDEHSVRQVLARWIQRAGHQVLEAESADAALQVMEKQPAAVVFCDIQMPGHDGIWLTSEVRKLYRNTAVVLATGVSTVAPGVSMQSGVLAYLVKPLSHEAVNEALNIALGWHTQTGATGPRAEDTPERLQEWLDSLE
jgi:DNA-binding NtrC family response regulator